MKTTGPFLLKRDNLQLGIVLGLLLPVAVFLIIYLVRFNEVSLPEFFNTFAAQKGLITFFGVWCLVTNIALFTYYVNTNKDQTAKGVFAVTLLYGIGILVVKVLV